MARERKKKPIEDMKVISVINGVEYENVEDIPMEYRQAIGQKFAQGLNDSLQRYLNVLPEEVRLNGYYALMRTIKEMGKDNFWGVIEAAPVIAKKMNEPDFDFEKYFMEPIEEIETIEEGTGKKKHTRTRCILYDIPYYFD